jgi:hypothetical protein
MKNIITCLIKQTRDEKMISISIKLMPNEAKKLGGFGTYLLQPPTHLFSRKREDPVNFKSPATEDN